MVHPIKPPKQREETTDDGDDDGDVGIDSDAAFAANVNEAKTYLETSNERGLKKFFERYIVPLFELQRDDAAEMRGEIIALWDQVGDPELDMLIEMQSLIALQGQYLDKLFVAAGWVKEGEVAELMKSGRLPDALPMKAEFVALANASAALSLKVTQAIADIEDDGDDPDDPDDGETQHEEKPAA